LGGGGKAARCRLKEKEIEMVDQPMIHCDVCGKGGHVQKVSEVYHQAQAAIPPGPITQKLKPPEPRKYKPLITRYSEGMLKFLLGKMGLEQSCPGVVVAMMVTTFLPIMLWGYIAVSLAALFTGGTTEDLSPAGLGVMVLFFCVPILVYFFYERRQKQAHELLENEHQARRMEEWESLYYCTACETPFSPGRGEVFIDEHEIVSDLSWKRVKKFEWSSTPVAPDAIESPSPPEVALPEVEAPAIEPEELEPEVEAEAAIMDYEVSNTCWFCGKAPRNPEFDLKHNLYGNVRKERIRGGPLQTRWDKAEIIVPRCADCHEAHKSMRRRTGFSSVLVVFISPLICFGTALLLDYTTWAWVLGVVLGLAVLVAVGVLGVRGEKQLEEAGIKGENKVTAEFEPIKELLERDWKIGFRPNKT
jgi:hypothetical protein